MLPVTRYNPGKYPPGPRFPQFGDAKAVSEVEEARAKLAAKRQGLAYFHLDRLERDGFMPVHSMAHILRPQGHEIETQTENRQQGHEIEMQTENPTDEIGIQTDMLRRTQREDSGDEQDIGGGQGTRGNLASRTMASARTGARHTKTIGDMAGAVGGGTLVAGGYVLGALGGLGWRAVKGTAGAVFGSSSSSEEVADAEPTPAPLAITAGGDPKPAFLLDEDERMAAAKKSSIYDTPAIQKEMDRLRLKKQKAEDEARAKKEAAEAVLRAHNIA